MVVAPVVAFWDDAGTPRKLEACPKLLLPFKTEINNDWFADVTEAQDYIDARTSNCVGYYQANSMSPPDWSSLSATDGGTSLDLAASSTNSASHALNPNFQLYGCINLKEGDILSCDYTLSVDDFSGAMSAACVLFEPSTWTSVAGTFDTGSSSGTLTFTVPYTGKFYVLVSAGGNAGSGVEKFVTGSFHITSSGDFSVNPVQALYNVGVVCPARLDCV
jgi:hypothetical protein